MPPHPYLDGPYPRAYAHRGWHLDELAGCENTMAAFRRAVAAPARGIGKASLDRMADGARAAGVPAGAVGVGEGERLDEDAVEEEQRRECGPRVCVVRVLSHALA